MSKSIFSVDRSNCSNRKYIVHVIDYISPVYENINPYGLTGAIIAFSKSVISCSAIALVFFLTIVSCQLQYFGHWFNDESICYCKFRCFFVMYGCIPLKQQEHVEYPSWFFLARGDSNISFSFLSLIMYCFLTSGTSSVW